ncbi:MAG: HTH domain-containing protein, partial [Syntrophorhabdaceae bacterium]|nr:HTH domain-containing protein [Syntrophorhabdaceae bacterium]
MTAYMKDKILNYINDKGPVSGATLAKMFNISR